MTTTIVTHDGGFHADDVCAVATLLIVLGVNAYDPSVRIIRTRDEGIISRADYVVDVGTVHDPKQKRFDHHQRGGAGKRDNGISYASFGLVWKEYGVLLSGTEAVATHIDTLMVTPIDALDNGEVISIPIHESVTPYSFSVMVAQYEATWKENAKENNMRFLELVEWTRTHLLRLITVAQHMCEAREHILNTYTTTEDKRIIVFDVKYPHHEVSKILTQKKEPLFIIYPQNGMWRARTVQKNMSTFENRKNFPTSWGGLTKKDLEDVTGVSGALFCHNKLFTVAAENRDAVHKLVSLALEA